jgi:hypothetical protein
MNFPSCAHVLKFEPYELRHFRLSPLQILNYLLQRTGDFALSRRGKRLHHVSSGEKCCAKPL